MSGRGEGGKKSRIHRLLRKAKHAELLELVGQAAWNNKKARTSAIGYQQ